MIKKGGISSSLGKGHPQLRGVELRTFLNVLCGCGSSTDPDQESNKDFPLISGFGINSRTCAIVVADCTIAVLTALICPNMSMSAILKRLEWQLVKLLLWRLRFRLKEGWTSVGYPRIGIVVSRRAGIFLNMTS